VPEKGEIHGRRQLEAAREAGESAGAGSVEPEGDKAVGFGIRQRAQQNAIDDAEDGGVGADADGEGEQDGNGESRSLAETAKGEAKIGDQGFERRPLPDFAAALLQEGGVAEFAARLLLGLLARHAVFHQFFSALGDVFLDGDGEVVVAAVARKEAVEQRHREAPTF
jgi:hypothetical protein